ncbi:MAG TPA: hypothetical protein VGP92_01225 [Acidimicrobiia bacterium]|nr:hypothetical protein [Acidimicrobiia bacterium]
MTTRIRIRYSKLWSWLFALLLMPQRFSYIEVDGDTIRIRMAFAFRSRFSRGDISAVSSHRPIVSVGVHGWRGRWLVNGAHRPIARITLALPVRARVLGVGVSVRELLVSVDDVAELQRALLT